MNRSSEIGFLTPKSHVVKGNKRCLKLTSSIQVLTATSTGPIVAIRP
jgi:hypothetical protein